MRLPHRDRAHGRRSLPDGRDHGVGGGLGASGTGCNRPHRGVVRTAHCPHHRYCDARREGRPTHRLGGSRGQFDCIDTTNNTNSLLLVLDQLKLLRHHTIAAPVSRFLFTEGPHNTAVIKDRKTSELWTVDPWTHKGSEVPDIFPLAKWKAGD